MSAAGPAARARPRVLVLLSQGWSVRNYAFSGFVERLARTCDVAAALPGADEDLVRELRERGARTVVLPDGRPGAAARALQSLLSRAHGHRHGHAPLRANRARLLREGSVVRRAALHMADGAARLVATAAFAPAARLEASVSVADLRGSPSARLIASERPDLVFATAPFELPDIAICRLARAAGIRSAAAVLSWDNPSSKSRMPPVHDRYFVWSEWMARDLVDAYPEIPPGRVLVTGTPQFDFHAAREGLSREEFCRSLDLEVDRTIVTYTASTERLVPGQAWIVERLCEAVDTGRIPGRPQILVRAHPLDDGAAFEPLRARGVRVARPWAYRATRPGWSLPTPRDLDLLVATLRHSAVAVNFFSTMTLDFALCDTPVVNVAFDPPACRERGIEVSLYYRYPHFRPVIEQRASFLARSADEMVDGVAEYLADPARDREGRRRLVGELCGPTDGGSAGRIADALAELARAGST